MSFRLDFYSDEELQQLVLQKSRMLNVNIEEPAALEIARRARMTARIAIRILKRVRDMAVVDGREVIDYEIAQKTLGLLDIDDNGLDMLDRNILKIIIEHFNNRPVGLSTLAASLSEEPDTIETVYEPFLIKKGLIKRTPKGRVVTHIGLREYGGEHLLGIEEY